MRDQQDCPESTSSTSLVQPWADPLVPCDPHYVPTLRENVIRNNEGGNAYWEANTALNRDRILKNYLQETERSMGFQYSSFCTIHCERHFRGRHKVMLTRPLHSMNPSRVSCSIQTTNYARFLKNFQMINKDQNFCSTFRRSSEIEGISGHNWKTTTS